MAQKQSKAVNQQKAIFLLCCRINRDPPVKTIISIRSQILLQLVVGLLYFPTEVFELAVQRVFQAGRVVVVHGFTRSQPTDGRKWRCWKKPRPSEETQQWCVRFVLPLIIENAAEAVLFVWIKWQNRCRKDEEGAEAPRQPTGEGVTWLWLSTTDRDRAADNDDRRDFFLMFNRHQWRSLQSMCVCFQILTRHSA